MIEPQSGRDEPLSVNGLSFFDSPVIAEQRPVHRSQERYQIDHPPPLRHSRQSDPNYRTYTTRPHAERSPFFRDSAYGSSLDRPTYYRRQHVPETTAIPFPSLERTPFTHTGQRQLAPNMPSIISSRSPIRPQPQWEGLKRMGVRSSRNEFGGSSMYPGRDLLSDVARRSVRR
ncbi:MAG: hypothetical protein EOO38_30290 [Cytophagaceae bacterium]|nr:MAG: hypothetical protein EOO38_30290 [Cytophagaceae bacterium]